jgi:hypothetical protein
MYYHHHHQVLLLLVERRSSTKSFQALQTPTIPLTSFHDVPVHLISSPIVLCHDWMYRVIKKHITVTLKVTHDIVYLSLYSILYEVWLCCLVFQCHFVSGVIVVYVLVWHSCCAIIHCYNDMFHIVSHGGYTMDLWNLYNVNVNECAVMEYIRVGSLLSASDIVWQVEELKA